MQQARKLAAELGDILNPALRAIRRCDAADFVPYDRYGTVLDGMTWRPLSVDEDGDLDIYMLRMEPGAQSYPHEHVGAEQFLVLEGSLIDCDGTRISAGHFARFEAGSTHHSTTEEGCLLLVMLRTRNRRLDQVG
ncbi:MAG: cupin domain-containing protein [Rhodospirillales bacterium]